MSQFDVYENNNSATRQAYPYLVNIQSEVLSELNTRVVLPLAREKQFKASGMARLTPQVEYQGESLLIMTPQISAISCRQLKEPLGSLAHLRIEIIDALDFVLGGV
jgi:toxin CcdB